MEENGGRSGHRREAASVGSAGAPEGGGRNGGWSGRCEGGGAVVVGREADEGPKENGGKAYALPPFVMRGCALLRLPDQKTITARETRFLLLRSVPYLYLFLMFTNIAWPL